ncbi:ATP-binding protein [Streptomyces sp. NPDC003077]|uniref:ATP-binding protein n=1 Tax=Streptomyces sp. NPDC003077 TaxID=3154443 RepID=UPI0033A1CCF3
MEKEITRTKSCSNSPDSERQFTVLLSATRRGARLGRLLATEQLRSWGLPLDTATLVIAELASNAALHGRVQGRDFRLSLSVVDADTLRIEVTDARVDRVPARRRPDSPTGAESGYGLLLVEELAERWGVSQPTSLSKTVWAECALYRSC